MKALIISTALTATLTVGAIAHYSNEPAETALVVISHGNAYNADFALTRDDCEREAATLTTYVDEHDRYQRLVQSDVVLCRTMFNGAR